MSAAANTLSGSAPKTAHTRVSGWAQLMRLHPYVARHKAEVLIGMFTQIGMGITGTLLPLIIGAIVDCIKGAEAPLAQLGRLTQISLGFLLPYYHPRNAHTLEIFCSALILICALQGLFSYWTRQILIGLSRDIEYDLRNDLLAKLVIMEPEFYVRNRTGELMSRCTNDLNSVRMVLGPGIMYSANTIATMVLAVVLMFWISATLSVYVLLPVPVVAITVWLFGRQIHALYGKIQASLAVLSAKAQENLAGVRVVRAYGQEDAEIRGFDGPNREYIDRNLRLIYFWSLFMPLLQMLDRADVCSRALAGRTARDPEPDHARRTDRVLHVHDAPDFPDDRAGIRDQHFPARRRFDGPAELHPRFGAEDQRRAMRSATRQEKFAAKLNSGI